MPNYSSLHSVRLFASNTNMLLTRQNMKLDSLIGNIFSFLFPFFLIIQFINNKINSIEAKQYLIQHLFKNFRINNQVIKKIKLIRESFNEFEEKKDTKDNMIDKCKELLESKPNLKEKSKDENSGKILLI